MITKYKTREGWNWRFDAWIDLPDGRRKRIQQSRIPTKEQAQALLSKRKAEAFEGRHFDRVRPSTLTVEDAWKVYEPVGKRDNDSWLTDSGRAKNLVRHLGKKLAASLTREDVDAYRTARLAEGTRRKDEKGNRLPPAPGTLDREVELLKRVLNYAVACGKLPANPIASVPLLNVPNTRRVIVTEDTFKKLVPAEPTLAPILLVAFDTGAREDEILNLKWATPSDAYGLDLAAGTIRLHPQETKANDDRVICLTGRTIEALKALPRRLGSPHVFANPETGRPWQDIRKMWRRACVKVGLTPGRKGVTFHDLRRSFATKAKRAGVPESVIMKMGGWKTGAVFKRYNIVEEQDMREAVKRIEAASADPECVSKTPPNRRGLGGLSRTAEDKK